jgi:hypothetical protein
MRLDNSTQYRVSGNVGGQHMCLRDAMAKGFDGFSTSAAEHGWRPLTFPPALLRSLTLRKGDKRSKGDPVPASFNDATSTHLITPLPPRGSGAGGEGRPPRGSGAGGEGRPLRGSGAGGEGGSSPSPVPFPLSHKERKGERGGWRERTLET